MTAPTRHNLLPVGRHFTGRETEVEDLGVRVEAARVVHLTGPAGVGKTDLARAVGHRALQGGLFPGGVFHISMEGATGVATLTGDLVFHLEVDETRAPEGPRRLVIWDQMDGVVSRLPEVVRRYFAAAAETDALHHLVVHRAAAPEDAGEVAALGPLGAEAAFAAFAAHLPDTVSTVPAPDDRALAEVLERLRGNPLAIRMASRWCRPPRWTNVLPEGLAAAASHAPADVEGPLAAGLALALADLDEPARRLMGLLAALPAGAGEVMLHAVYGDEWAAPAALLERTGLVETLGDRYILHPAARTVAPAVLGPRQAATLWSQVAYYLHQLLMDWKTRVRSGGQDPAQRFIVREWENLRATFNWAMDRLAEGGVDEEEDARLAIDCGASAFHVMYARGMFREGLAWMEATRPVAERFGTPFDRAGLSDYTGLFQTRLGDREAARASFEAAVAGYGESEYPTGVGTANYHLGLVHAAGGDMAAARASFEDAVEKLRGSSGRSFAPQAATHLGLLQLDQGEVETAYETLTDALGLYEEHTESALLRVRAGFGLAEAALRSGREAESPGHAERALDLLFRGHPRTITGVIPQMLRLTRVYLDADDRAALEPYVRTVVDRIDRMRRSRPRKDVARDWALASEALGRVAALLTLAAVAFGPKSAGEPAGDDARRALPEAARALDQVTGGVFAAERWLAERLAAG